MMLTDPIETISLTASIGITERCTDSEWGMIEDFLREGDGNDYYGDTEDTDRDMGG